MRRILVAAGVLVLGSLSQAAAPVALAQQKTEFKVGITDYVGYAPLYAADKMGIAKKWADKYGVTLNLVKSADYTACLNDFTTGDLDSCLMTTMDALTGPVASGTDATALVLIDFSNGADAVIMKKGMTLKDLKGHSVGLVQYSVSQYLLTRALQSVGLSEKDVKIADASEADIVNKFKSDPATAAVATWEPHVSELLQLKDADTVFTSAKIPGEIIDAIVVSSKVLKDNPNFGKALTGAWYETMGIITGSGDQATNARKLMAEFSQTTPEDVASTLKDKIKMFYTPKDATEFFSSPQMVKTMDLTRNFAVEHKLFGEGVTDVNAIGMTFPKATLGDQGKILMRFNETFTAAAGS
jgi:NitT/TauT family transport system substrate-binding protein